jgi:hypothetical protein
MINTYDLLSYIFSLIIFSIASAQDLRSREVNPILWLVSGFVGIMLLILRFDHIIIEILILNIIFSMIILILSLTGFMGFADFFGYLILSILMPRPLFEDLILPPILIIMLFSNIFLALYVAPSIFKSFKKIFFIRSVCSSRLRSFMIALTGSPMTIDNFLRSRFMYPLIYPQENNEKIIWTCRSSYDINEDPEKFKEDLRRLLNKNLVSKDDLVIASWGAPYLVFVLIALATYPITSVLTEHVLYIILFR